MLGTIAAGQSYNPNDQHSVQLERIERRLAMIQRYLEKDPTALRDLIKEATAVLISEVTAEAVLKQSVDIQTLIRAEISKATLNIRFFS